MAIWQLCAKHGQGSKADSVSIDCFYTYTARCSDVPRTIFPLDFLPQYLGSGLVIVSRVRGEKSWGIVPGFLPQTDGALANRAKHSVRWITEACHSLL